MTVTVGLVGAGHRATTVHAPALARARSTGAGLRFAGVWSRSPAAAGRLATRHGVVAFDRFSHVLDRCDALTFAVPPPVQAELAAVAAGRGRAVLLERPIAGDTAGAEELAHAIHAAQVVSQLALAWRYTVAVRRFLDSDAPAVTPVGGHGRRIAGRFSPGDTANWRRQAGVLLDQGPDLVDLLDAALGSVVGVRAHGHPRGWVGLALDHQVGRFSEASLFAMGTEERKADVSVFGPGGSAAVDCMAALSPAAFDTMYREFAEAITLDTPHPLDVRRGLHLQRVVEAAESDLADG